MKRFMILASLVAFSFVSAQHKESTYEVPIEVGQAKIYNTDSGEDMGEIAIFENPSGIEIIGEFWGFTPGKHAIHVHEFGDVGNGGNNAGGHYNPEHTPHGYSPLGDLSKAHPGDLGNIDVAENGKGRLHVLVPGVFLQNARYCIAGRSFIIHAGEDQFTQPVGDAGDRVAGGLITIVSPASIKIKTTPPARVKKKPSKKGIDEPLPSNVHSEHESSSICSPAPKTEAFRS